MLPAIRTASLTLVAAFAATGCATKGFVSEQLAPLEQRLGAVEQGLRGTQSDVARALTAMSNLKLERSLVLDLSEGANFASGSSQLRSGARQEIDRFLAEIDERDRTSPAWSSRHYVVAGHTDSLGSDDMNYDLGQRRAQKVASYLIGQKGIDPLHVSAVSYGETTPIADNGTRTGRSKNRRVEIRIFNEKISGD